MIQDFYDFLLDRGRQRTARKYLEAMPVVQAELTRITQATSNIADDNQCAEAQRDMINRSQLNDDPDKYVQSLMCDAHFWTLPLRLKK